MVGEPFSVDEKTGRNQHVMGPSILRRFVYSSIWFVFGCLFFYVTLVLMSLYSKGTTLETMPYNAWSRMASRATGAITTPFYVMALLVSPASLASLFFTVMTICSHLVHLMILATDTKVFSGAGYTDALKAQRNHPLLEHIPTPLLLGYGILGYVCMFFIGLERVYGPGLGKRANRMNIMCKVAHYVIWSVFVSFFTDRLWSAIKFNKSQEELLYPIGFLSILLLGAIVTILRHSGVEKVDAESTQVQAPEKKTN